MRKVDKIRDTGRSDSNYFNPISLYNQICLQQTEWNKLNFFVINTYSFKTMCSFDFGLFTYFSKLVTRIKIGRCLLVITRAKLAITDLVITA